MSEQQTSTYRFMRRMLVVIAMVALVGCGRADDQKANDSAGMGRSTEGDMGSAGNMPEGDMTAVRIVAEGTFVDRGGQTTRGSYRIEIANGTHRLVLGDDFRTNDGPDLHVVLSPAHVDELESANATSDDSTVIVAPLNGFEGPQVFDLPDQVDLSAYNAVLIHCVEFSHLYGAAPIASR